MVRNASSSNDREDRDKDKEDKVKGDEYVNESANELSEKLETALRIDVPENKSIEENSENESKNEAEVSLQNDNLNNNNLNNNLNPNSIPPNYRIKSQRYEFEWFKCPYFISDTLASVNLFQVQGNGEIFFPDELSRISVEDGPRSLLRYVFKGTEFSRLPDYFFRRVRGNWFYNSETSTLIVCAFGLSGDTVFNYKKLILVKCLFTNFVLDYKVLQIEKDFKEQLDLNDLGEYFDGILYGDVPETNYEFVIDLKRTNYLKLDECRGFVKFVNVLGQYEFTLVLNETSCVKKNGGYFYFKRVLFYDEVDGLDVNAFSGTVEKLIGRYISRKTHKTLILKSKNKV